ncbi:MAG: citrate synthase, partial [Spirochaetes bacterium]
RKTFDRTGLIYGMGHAVYTYSDPRAVILKEKAKELAKEKGASDEYELYTLVEKLTPKVFRDIKNSKKIISANVDFYSGFVYSLLGIPADLYTPIFAIARIAGWSAHRIEELINGGRIMRPAYKHISQEKKDLLPLAERNQE